MSQVSKYSGFQLYEENGGVEAVINQQLVEYFLQVDEKGNFLHPPKDDNELDTFIQLAYGIRLPRKVLTKGHRSPLEFVCDLFFERVRTVLAFANRTGGKSFTTALLNHLDMIFKKGCDITSAGAVKDQAKRQYRHFQDFNKLPFFAKFCENYAKTVGRRFDHKLTMSETSYDNGSQIEIITGSEQGFRGPHPHKSRVDEVDELEWSVLQTAFSMSKSGNGILGQDVFTSTRQKRHGAMQRLLDERVKRGIKVYEWDIWDILEKCPRHCVNDPVHGTCPVIQLCNGKAHHSDGHYSIGDFIEKATQMDSDRFKMEWENNNPLGERLVYSHFSESRHVMTPERLFKMTGCRKPSEMWSRVSGLDFGASPGNPFVYLKLCRLPRGEWLIFWEYVAEQRLLRDHAASIKASPFFSTHELIYGDWDAQDRLELRKCGVSISAAVKGPDSISVGIDKVNEYLQGYPPTYEPVLYVWEDCTYTIKEFGSYIWPVTPDGKVNKTGRPDDGFDHAMDAMRYALFSYYRSGGNRYRSRTMAGV